LVKQSNLNFSFVSLGGSFLPHTLKIISGIILGIIFLYSKLDLGRFKMNKIKNAYRINVPDRECYIQEKFKKRNYSILENE